MNLFPTGHYKYYIVCTENNNKLDQIRKKEPTVTLIIIRSKNL